VLIFADRNKEVKSEEASPPTPLRKRGEMAIRMEILIILKILR